MAVQIGAGSQPDFNEPIALMMDCHRRIERFLLVLLRVVTEARGGKLTPEYREALQTSLDYFKAAAPRHTEDEEHSLFPRMRQCDDETVRQALAAIEQLEEDHEEAAQKHERIDALGRAWLTTGTLGNADVQELSQLITELQASYAEHIDLEDTVLFPLAQRVLAKETLAAVGQEMAARRALDPGRPGSRCAERRARLTTPQPE